MRGGAASNCTSYLHVSASSDKRKLYLHQRNINIVNNLKLQIRNTSMPEWRLPTDDTPRPARRRVEFDSSMLVPSSFDPSALNPRLAGGGGGR